jgi:tetraacyldisaccharide-1-P 4'-kinase
LAQKDLQFGDGLDVLMTEKDAVKAGGIATAACWYVTVDVRFPGSDTQAWLDEVYREMTGREAKSAG